MKLGQNEEIGLFRENLNRLKAKIAEIENEESFSKFEKTKSIEKPFKKFTFKAARTQKLINENSNLENKSDSRIASPDFKIFPNQSNVSFKISNFDELHKMQENLSNLNKKELICLNNQLCSSISKFSQKCNEINFRMIENFKKELEIPKEEQRREIELKLKQTDLENAALKNKLEKKRIQIAKLKAKNQIQRPETDKKQTNADLLVTCEQESAILLNLKPYNSLQSQRFIQLGNNSKAQNQQAEAANLFAQEKIFENEKLNEEIKKLKTRLENDRSKITDLENKNKKETELKNKFMLVEVR